MNVIAIVLNECKIKMCLQEGKEEMLQRDASLIRECMRQCQFQDIHSKIVMLASQN